MINEVWLTHPQDSLQAFITSNPQRIPTVIEIIAIYRLTSHCKWLLAVCRFFPLSTCSNNLRYDVALNFRYAPSAMRYVLSSSTKN
jgi:hypothetical protein